MITAWLPEPVLASEVAATWQQLLRFARGTPEVWHESILASGHKIAVKRREDRVGLRISSFLRPGVEWAGFLADATDLVRAAELPDLRMQESQRRLWFEVVFVGAMPTLDPPPEGER